MVTECGLTQADKNGSSQLNNVWKPTTTLCDGAQGNKMAFWEYWISPNKPWFTRPLINNKGECI